jgi:hypothetical protein
MNLLGYGCKWAWETIQHHITQKQGQHKAWHIPSPKNLTRWPWPWKSIGFQILLRTKYIPSRSRSPGQIFRRGYMPRFVLPLFLCDVMLDSLSCSFTSISFLTNVNRTVWFGQNPLKDVDSRMFTRMLRKDGSDTISLRNFVDEGIINSTLTSLLD